MGVATLGVGLPASCLLPSLFMYAIYGILSRRRDDRRRRFACVVFSLPWGHVCFIRDRESASRRSAQVCQHRVLWLPCSYVRFFGVLNCSNYMRFDAWLRFASILSCVFPRFMHDTYGIFSRRRDDRRSDSRRRHAIVLSCGFPRLRYVFMEYCVGVGLSGSYCIASGCSSWLDLEFDVGAATIFVAILSVGSITSCRMTSRSSATLYMKHFGVWTTGIATLGVC
jgi:hypothetical protein